MTALQGYYNAGDSKTWRLAYSLQRLCTEVAVRWPDITNLGTKGDASHALQGVQSDHNALWLKPGDPLKIVRAVDFGGPYDQLMELRAHLYALGAAKFGPLWSFGYLKGPDSKGCAWPIGSGWNNNSGDEGHLHVSVTQTNGYSPLGGTAGYVAAIDSAESWGIADGTDLTSAPLGGGTQLSEEDDMTQADVDAINENTRQQVGALAQQVQNQFQQVTATLLKMGSQAPALEDERGAVWVKTDDGLYHLSPEEWSIQALFTPALPVSSDQVVKASNVFGYKPRTDGLYPDDVKIYGFKVRA